MKEKIVYREVYKKKEAQMKDSCLPVLKHLNDGFVVSDAYLVEAGLSERAGIKQEYQVIRVYLSETK